MDIKKDFWLKYIEADYFDKSDLLKTLPLLKDLDKLKNIESDKVFEYIIISLFRDYLDDVIEVCKEDEPRRTKEKE